METTTNYKLPQWVKADQIKMDTFNDAFGKIDAQMKKNADKANAAASAESVGTQITAVQEQIVAVEQEIKLVSLGEPRTFKKLPAPQTGSHLLCRLLLEKKKNNTHRRRPGSDD